MKKIGLMFLGILIGVFLTIGSYELYIRTQPSYRWFKHAKKAFGFENAKDISSDGFLAISFHDDNDEEYHLYPREHPFQQLIVDKSTTINTTNLDINIQDRHSITLLRDMDFDGVWDQRFVFVNHTKYYYGKESGFPVYIKTTSNEVLRVHGKYYDLHRKGEKMFIVKNDNKLEVNFSDIDHLKLIPFTNQVNDSVGQKYTEKELQDFQMKAIREGMPPIPISLSKENDDKLVKEGVLPPKEN